VLAATEGVMAGTVKAQDLYYNASIFFAPGVTGLIEPNGISGNEIVGSDYLNPFETVSFEYNGSTSTTFSVPRSSATIAEGVSGNNIVGYYLSGSSVQAFLYSGASFTTLSVPGETWEEAYGVYGNNVVGAYTTAGGSTQGFLFNGTSYTTLSVPGAQDTYARGISGNNIVGYYTVGNATEGFIYNGTSFTSVGGQDTYLDAIDGNEIVGHTGSSSFVYEDGSFFLINIGIVRGLPEEGLVPAGISDGTIVGIDETGVGNAVPFLATPVPEPSALAILTVGTVAIELFRRRRG
jgi:hypothetical protein